jgi:hypothetical protein
LREATSVNKGWVAVGLVLLVSGIAGFQVIDLPAYAQAPDNGTLDTSSLTDSPSNLLQNQLEPDQDSLIATPGLSSDDLNPSTQRDSAKDGDNREQRTPTPNTPTRNTPTSSENIGDELGINTDETIENSIVQDRLPQDRALAPSQPDTDDNDDQDAIKSDDQDQQDNEQDSESNDNENDEAEEAENEQDVTEENDGTDEIPSSLRMHEDIVPFP